MPVEATPERMQREETLAALLLTIFRSHRADFRAGEFAASVEAALRPSFEETFAVSYLLWLASDEQPFGVNRAQFAAQRWAGMQAREVAGELARRVAGGIESGSLPADLLSDTRAASITATETTRAQTIGQQTARKEVTKSAALPDSPIHRLEHPLIGGGAIWITVGDDRVCPICRPLDEKPESAWINLFPLGPPAHPNCRCILERAA